MPLLSPKVRGPLSPLSTSVTVEHVLPNSWAEILVNGSPIQRQNLATTNSVTVGSVIRRAATRMSHPLGLSGLPSAGLLRGLPRQRANRNNPHDHESGIRGSGFQTHDQGVRRRHA